MKIYGFEEWKSRTQMPIHTNSNRNISPSTNIRWRNSVRQTNTRSLVTKCTFVLNSKRLPCVFDYFFFFSRYSFKILHEQIRLIFLEKKGGGGDDDEGKSMSHWEYIMHDCCCAHTHTQAVPFTFTFSLKCVPHRYLSGCHIWATLKCGDENRWNVCEHTHSLSGNDDFMDGVGFVAGWVSVSYFIWINGQDSDEIHTHKSTSTHKTVPGAKHQNILVFFVYCLWLERWVQPKCIRMKFDREIKSTLKCMSKPSQQQASKIKQKRKRTHTHAYI